MVKEDHINSFFSVNNNFSSGWEDKALNNFVKNIKRYKLIGLSQAFFSFLFFDTAISGFKCEKFGDLDTRDIVAYEDNYGWTPTQNK